MKITKDNLNEVLFENQDARLLIADVVAHTSANLYYYHDVEITVQKALDIWHKAQAADGEENGFFKGAYTVAVRFAAGIFIVVFSKRVSQRTGFWRHTPDMVIRPRPGPATEENLNQAIPGIMIKKGRRYTNGRLLRGQPGTGDDH